MKRFFNSAAVCMAALALASCGQSGQSSDAQSTVIEGDGARSVVVTSAKIGVIPQESYYSASIQANAINNIAPQSASRIQKLFAEVGDFVEAGQKVAEMDHVQLDQAELRLRNSEIELERARQLLSEGGMAQSDYESMELSCNVARSTYENLLENTVLVSPIKGVISARNYDRGDVYSMSQPIYTVQQITPVKILVGVSESDYTRVSRGDAISLTVDAIPDRTFKGKIIRLYPVMDASTHTFNVEIQIPNSDRILRPGMYAKVCINFGETNNVLLPDYCVIKQQGSGRRTVFVVNDKGCAESRIVNLGRHFDGNYEIISGVNEGDKVVVRGQNTLRTGDKLQIEAEQ